MHVHIGEKIKERMRELRISPAFLAEKINTTRQNIYGIFRRKSIDTDLLVRISEVLKFNFFSLYLPEESGKAQQISRDEFDNLMHLVKDIQMDYQAIINKLDKKKKKRKS